MPENNIYKLNIFVIANPLYTIINVIKTTCYMKAWFTNNQTSVRFNQFLHPSTWVIRNPVSNKQSDPLITCCPRVKEASYATSTRLSEFVMHLLNLSHCSSSRIIGFLRSLGWQRLTAARWSQEVRWSLARRKVWSRKQHTPQRSKGHWTNVCVLFKSIFFLNTFIQVKTFKGRTVAMDRSMYSCHNLFIVR